MAQHWFNWFTVTANGVEWTCIPLGNDPTVCSVVPTDAARKAISGEVTIPAEVVDAGGKKFSVTEIEEGALAGCRGLTAINVDAGNPSYCAIGGVLFSKDRKTLVCCPGGKTGAYKIPGSVTVIGEGAFADCSRLTEVTIPNSVTQIGAGAFEYCTGLTAVTIPEGVTQIGGRAFLGCSGLEAVYWLAGASVKVGIWAFSGIASPATLYVRRGEKAKIEANGIGRWKGFTIVERRF